MIDVGSMVCETFTPHVGSAFRVRVGEEDAGSWVLVSAVAHVARAADTRFKRVPFTLTFRGGLSPVWRQGLFRFQHDALGEFEVFAVPVGPDQGGMQYEVQFS